MEREICQAAQPHLEAARFEVCKLREIKCADVLLGSLCRSIAIDKVSSPDGIILGQIKDIIKKASTCPLCKIFYVAMTKYMTYFVTNGDEPAILSYDLGEHHLLLRAGPQSKAQVAILISTLENDPSASRFNVQPLLRYADTASDDAYEKIKKWLDTCISQHYCYKPRYLPDSTGFPARLIDLDYFGATSQDARLWTRPTRHNYLYATLSYCWGSAGKRFKTTNATLVQRAERIAYTDLPLTFRDAFTICRRLSIRYLWIDSICIIQDSLEDWRQEAAKMSSIYSLATITIAADWSPDGDGGIFNRADKRRLAELPSYLTVRTKLATSGEASTLFFHTNYRGLGSTPLPIDTGAVQKRGWCYQERALSPRVLHYTATQLIWECRTGFEHQAHPEWNWRHSTREPLPALFLRTRLTFGSQQSEVLRLWYETIIPEFSQRAITFQSDKLPAIAGLAQIAATYIGGEYVAGLWVNELVFGLAWNREGKLGVTDKICSSWSWARIGGGVMWPLRRHKIGIDPPLATVVDVHVERVGPDPFGAVTGGILKLSGKLVGPMTVSQNDNLIDMTGIGSELFMERSLLDGKGEKIGMAVTDDATFIGKVYCFMLWHQRLHQMAHLLLLTPCKRTGTGKDKFEKSGSSNEINEEKREKDGQEETTVYQRVGKGDIDDGKFPWQNAPDQIITIV